MPSKTCAPPSGPQSTPIPAVVQAVEAHQRKHYMIKFAPSVSNVVIVGCGGVASWMIAPLIKLLKGCDHQPGLVYVDGDTIEERNLDRQLFFEKDIGKNKADAMAGIGEDYHSIITVQDYYSDGSRLPVNGMSLFLGCADNHAARRAILNAVDRNQGWAIIAGNEYTEAEAYYYEQGMKDSPVDPRMYYPAILTDNTGDPLRPRGCTGAAAIAAPQLVLANFSAANHMLWLVYHHFVERHQNREYVREFMPVKTWNFGTRFITTRACDLKVKEAK